ncbi:DNA replication ATP-dependent helicase/nuclease JHS1 [Linum grandiflorum]
MDEAGQITFPISLGPLMFSSMFVLVGDRYQLSTLVQVQSSDFSSFHYGLTSLFYSSSDHNLLSEPICRARRLERTERA